MWIGDMKSDEWKDGRPSMICPRCGAPEGRWNCEATLYQNLPSEGQRLEEGLKFFGTFIVCFLTLCIGVGVGKFVL